MTRTGAAGSRLHPRIDEERGVILGATFTSTDLADSLHTATIALIGEIPVKRLWNPFPSFLARNEICLNPLEKRQTELAGEHAKNGPHAEDNPDSRTACRRRRDSRRIRQRAGQSPL